MTAKSLVLKSPFDVGVPGPEHFDIVESQVTAPEGDGDIQVQLIAVSADPYLRNIVKSTGSVKAGDRLPAFVVGKVIASNENPKWKVGDLFGANLPIATIQNISASSLASATIWKLSGLLTEEEITLGLGVLGMPGSTAYAGVFDILRPNEGETIFVSAASGAVGSLVGLIAKHVFKCKVIGSCGGPEKCALIKEKFGYDHAIDYKALHTKEDLKAALKAIAPDGIDMYFENVGGFHFEAAFESLRPFGRIAVCGGISMYNDESFTPLAINLMAMVYTFQRIEGFLCIPWLRGEKGNFLADMYKFLQEGKVVSQETIFHGLESYGEAFQSLFTGKNLGKVVVRI